MTAEELITIFLEQSNPRHGVHPDDFDLFRTRRKRRVIGDLARPTAAIVRQEPPSDPIDFSGASYVGSVR